MGRDHLIERPDWLLSSRRRRFRIGDLMVAVVMTAIGLAVISLPELTLGERQLLGAAVLSFLGLEWTSGPSRVLQHASHIIQSRSCVECSRPCCHHDVVALVVSGFSIRKGSLLSLLIVIHVVYLTTWD